MAPTKIRTRFIYRRRQLLLLAGVMFAVIFSADQFTKTRVLQAHHLGEIPHAFGEYFNLVLVWNRGVSFGMLAQDAAWGPWALKALAAVLMIVLLRWLWNATTILQAVSLGMVLGGAVGNVVDRFRYGAVVDFLDFHYATTHYPAFNIADAGICIGVVLLVLESIISPSRRSDDDSHASHSS